MRGQVEVESLGNRSVVRDRVLEFSGSRTCASSFVFGVHLLDW
jgi:hypothetical protein